MNTYVCLTSIYANRKTRNDDKTKQSESKDSLNEIRQKQKTKLYLLYKNKLYKYAFKL